MNALNTMWFWIVQDVIDKCATYHKAKAVKMIIPFSGVYDANFYGSALRAIILMSIAVTLNGWIDD